MHDALAKTGFGIASRLYGPRLGLGLAFLALAASVSCVPGPEIGEMREIPEIPETVRAACSSLLSDAEIASAYASNLRSRDETSIREAVLNVLFNCSLLGTVESCLCSGLVTDWAYEVDPIYAETVSGDLGLDVLDSCELLETFREVRGGCFHTVYDCPARGVVNCLACRGRDFTTLPICWVGDERFSGWCGDPFKGSRFVTDYNVFGGLFFDVGNLLVTTNSGSDLILRLVDVQEDPFNALGAEVPGASSWGLTRDPDRPVIYGVRPGGRAINIISFSEEGEFFVDEFEVSETLLGLTVGPDSDVLYASTTNGVLLAIDPDERTDTEIGPLGSTIISLAFNRNLGILYGIGSVDVRDPEQGLYPGTAGCRQARTPFYETFLFVIDTDDATTTRMGSTGMRDISDLAFDTQANVLNGVQSSGPQLIAIDVETAEVTAIVVEPVF